MLEHLHQLLFSSFGQFLNSGSLSEEGEKKDLWETLIFTLNVMFKRTLLSCYSWLCATTGKEVHEKCYGKYVLINVLFGRQNLSWRGGKRKKKYQSTFHLSGGGRRNTFFTVFDILLLPFFLPTFNSRLSGITVCVCTCAGRAWWNLKRRIECLDERLYRNFT